MTLRMFTGPQLTAFRKSLLNWFRKFQRDLPWRRTKDPYWIWISEIMLQQTRVAAVIPYYRRFLERFQDIRSLAEGPEEEVLRMWSGLGYYSRARNLQKAAQQIVERHGGKFPQDREEAGKLSGIGDYTSAAILSIAFGKEHAVLDGNVARVLARLGAIRGDLREAKRWQRLRKEAGALLDSRAPGDWNQAMMELGATVCTPRAPQCLLCPVAKFCRARKLGDPELFPEKREKTKPVEIVLAAAVLWTPSGETLLLPPPSRGEKRPAADDVGTLVSGMWHFPTVAVDREPRGELREFLGGLLPAKRRGFELEPLAQVKHAVTYRRVTVQPFRLAMTRIPQRAGAKILALAQVSSLPVSNLTRKIAAVAMAGLARNAEAAEEMQSSLLWRGATASSTG